MGEQEAPDYGADLLTGKDKDMNIQKGKQAAPSRVVLYGIEGIGKSTLASKFPNALTLDTEDRTRHLDIHREVCRKYGTLVDALDELMANKTEYKTLVLDTADWAQALTIDAVLSEKGFTSIEDPGYGRGYTYVYEKMQDLLTRLTRISEQWGMHVVVVAHARICKFDDPITGASYDRYALKLQDSPKSNVAALFKEWADALLFCNYDISAVKGKDDKVRAVGGHAAMIFPVHTAAYDAKNSWGLKEPFPMEYEFLRAHIETDFNPNATQDRKRKIALYEDMCGLIGKDALTQWLADNNIDLKAVDVAKMEELVEDVREVATQNMNDGKGTQQ